MVMLSRRPARGSGKTSTPARPAAAPVAILDGGAIVHSEAFGMADRATGTPVTINTTIALSTVARYSSRREI